MEFPPELSSFFHSLVNRILQNAAFRLSAADSVLQLNIELGFLSFDRIIFVNPWRKACKESADKVSCGQIK